MVFFPTFVHVRAVRDREVGNVAERLDALGSGVVDFPIVPALGAHAPAIVAHASEARNALGTAAFALAAEEWSRATDGHADATFDGEWPPHPLNDHVIHRGEPGSLGAKRGMSYWHTPPAGERQPTEMMIVPDRVVLEGLPWVIAHELGHHWNLRHSGNPDDLMYSSAARHISPRDVDRFCERQGC